MHHNIAKIAKKCKQSYKKLFYLINLIDIIYTHQLYVYIRETAEIVAFKEFYNISSSVDIKDFV